MTEQNEWHEENLPHGRTGNVQELLSGLYDSLDESNVNKLGPTILALMRQYQAERTITKPEPVSQLSSAYTDIFQFLRVILNNWWVILIVSIIGSVAAYFIIEAQPSIYEVETSIAIMPTIDDDAIPRPLDQMDIALGTYVQVLRSQNLITRAESELLESFDEDLVDSVKVQVRPVENSSIIVVMIQARSAELALAYAEAITNQLINENPLPRFELAYRPEILDAPVLPDTPSLPNKLENFVLVSLGFFIVGVLLAFLRDTYFKASSVRTAH